MALHVIQRGHNRAECFRRDGDYMLYLLHLRELSEGVGCRVHAYCLMTNHVHLLLTPETREACSELMRNLGQRYVQCFNRVHARTGTLWEGRFRSCLVDSARYLLACYRYIERNPVRAGMVRHPADYAWSSYRGNAGLSPDLLLSPHPQYLALAAGVAARQRAYRDLLGEEMEAATTAEIRSATNACRALGDGAFVDEMSLALGRRLALGRAGRPVGVQETRKRRRAESGSDPDSQKPSQTLS